VLLLWALIHSLVTIPSNRQGPANGRAVRQTAALLAYPQGLGSQAVCRVATRRPSNSCIARRENFAANAFRTSMELGTAAFERSLARTLNCTNIWRPMNRQSQETTVRERRHRTVRPRRYVTLRTLRYAANSVEHQNNPCPINSCNENPISAPHFRQALSRAGPL
jgi:hypothetical protein